MDSLLGGLDQGTPVPPTPRRFVKGGLSVDPYNTSALSAPTTATSVSAPGSPDVSDYVRYLLQGTGAESNVDFTRLRRELEDLDTDTDRAAVVGDSHGDAASEFVSPATDDASIEKILRESMRDREARRGGAGAGAGAGADDSFADFFGGGSKNNEQQQYDVAQHNNNRSSLPPTDSSLPPSRPHSRTVSIPTTAAPTTNNNNRSSAAQALEAELALWRSQKSRWAADIARRRASLDEVHKLVNEPTFGGGMTMLLEGLAGLRFQQENNIGSSANKHEQYDDEELEESPVPSDLPPLPGSKTATTTVAPTPTPRPAPAVPAHHQATPARTPQITVTTDSPHQLPVLTALSTRLSQSGFSLPPISLSPRHASLLSDLLTQILDSLDSKSQESTALKNALDSEEAAREAMEVEVDEARRMMEVAEGVVEGLRSEREASEKRQEREVEVFKADADKLRSENARLRLLCTQLRDKATQLDASASERGRLLESLERERRELLSRDREVPKDGRDDWEREREREREKEREREREREGWMEQVDRERRLRLASEAELSSTKRELESATRKLDKAQDELHKFSQEAERSKFELQALRTELERTKTDAERERERARLENDRLRLELERRIESSHHQARQQVVPPVTPRTAIQQSGLVKDVQGLQEEVASLREELEARRMAEAVRRGGEEQGEGASWGEVEMLKKLLEKAERELESQRETTEVLKLQVLANKRAEWVARTDKRSTAARPKTRDLIRRDKEAFRLKLFRIEGMEEAECQELLKDICVKLDVADVNKLLPALDEVEAALRLFPQLRSFVASIDTLVWNTDQPNRKLDETLQALQSWAGVVGEVNALRKFRGEVHLLVGIPESGRSEGACLEALRGVKEAAERKVKERVETADASYAKMIRHFRNLFDVPQNDGVIPRINQLYVFEAEVESGLRRLRSMLRLSTRKPSEILAETIRFAAQRMGVVGLEAY